MPRTAREKSATGVYHVIVRGINRQEIFYDDEDRGVYIDRLARYKEECGFEVYAYCLMGNHVHLLLKEGQEEISSIMKKIGASYAYWYNWKYERTGHLFQDRYRSEPVEDDVYLLSVVRYIHQNPVKAGIADSSENYLWSSYNEYMKCKKIVTTELVFEMFKNIKEFEKYMNGHADDGCMEIEENKRLNDEEVKTIIKNLTRKSDPMALQEMELTKRNEIIVGLKKVEGVSIRQISRLTGINRNIIQRL